MNVAENLSLPRRWKRLPEGVEQRRNQQAACSRKSPRRRKILCDQAILELAYASGLRLSELKNLRLEQLHLDAGFINVIGKGNKERVVPVGRTAVAALNRFIEAGRPKLVTPKSPANVFLTQRGTPFAAVTLVAAHQEPRPARRRGAQHHAAHVAAQLRDASAGAWRGFAGDPGIARPREHQHDGDLHARHGQPAAGNPSEISSAGVNVVEDAMTADSFENLVHLVTQHISFTQNRKPQPFSRTA